MGIDMTAFNKYRNMVVGVNTRVPLSNGSNINAVNFDNAATTPAFFSVLKEINDFLPWYSSIHRGKGYKSTLSSQIYDNGRNLIRQFVNADRDKDVVIYTKNATDAINTLAYTLAQDKSNQDVVLSTWMEHAANDLPWRDKFNIDYVEIDKNGRLSLEDLETKLNRYQGRVKLLTVTGASNVTGYINPIHKIAGLAHLYGTRILIDGAQLVPHAKVDMKPFGTLEHIDYLVFSAHKMYAPFGSGVLIGPKEVFYKGLPYCEGGSAISLVTHNRIDWEEPPQKNEAGTPNLMGVVAMLAAVKTLASIGMDNVHSCEKNLYDYAINKIRNVPGMKFYSDTMNGDTISVIPFNMDGVHHQLMSAILSFEFGIAVRNGFFCSHPYCERLLGLTEKDMEYYFQNPEALRPGLVRVSFGLYNTYSEIDRLFNALNIIAANKEYFAGKYLNNRALYRISNEV